MLKRELQWADFDEPLPLDRERSECNLHTFATAHSQRPCKS